MANFDANTLTNATVYGQDREKIGKVGQLYMDDQSGEPTFVTVSTGLFGTKETFVPVKDAREENGDLYVPYTKDFVKDAPNMDPDEHLSEEEQDRLFAYYAGQGGSAGQSGYAAAGTTGTAGERTTTEGAAAGTAGAVTGGAATGGDTDAEVIRREEQLKVGTETREAGRARLRKYVTSETENVQVPVSHEEVRVERTPVSEGEGVSGAPLGEEETEVTLREERPVVSKETVGAEKVSLDKEKVEDTETVQADLAKEHVEVEGADEDRGRGTR
jgi:uncharacterized protein (TIGR02271 family)